VAEEFHLGLLELTRAEGEVSRIDLVAKRLADLGDPEGDFLARRLSNPLEAREDRLQVSGRR